MYCNHIDLIALQYHLYKIILSLQMNIFYGVKIVITQKKLFIYIYIYKIFVRKIHQIGLQVY
jgi:hypothetical protein